MWPDFRVNDLNSIFSRVVHKQAIDSYHNSKLMLKETKADANILDMSDTFSELQSTLFITCIYPLNDNSLQPPGQEQT